MKARGAVLLMVMLAFFPAWAADLGPGWDQQVVFGMEGKFTLNMPLSAAEAPIAALAPHIAPPGPPAIDESVRIVGPYRWKDCLLDVSFYFSGAGPEGARKLQTVLVQTVSDGQELCQAEMRSELDNYAPTYAAPGLLSAAEGRAWRTDNIGVNAALSWPSRRPALRLFASSAAIDPGQSLPMARIDAVPLPEGPITLSQFAGHAEPNQPDISFALSREAAAAALAACPVTTGDTVVVAQVLGPHGHLMALLADGEDNHFDYSSFTNGSYDRARMNAYVVLQTHKPSRAFTGKQMNPHTGSDDGILHAPPLSAADMIAGAGALPIWRGDAVAGVISVYGALDARHVDDFDRDEACAQAGIDRIKDRLAPLKKP